MSIPTETANQGEVTGEIYECNFENEGFTVVSFSVPADTRWRAGKYKIVRLDDPVLLPVGMNTDPGSVTYVK